MVVQLGNLLQALIVNPALLAVYVVFLLLNLHFFDEVLFQLFNLSYNRYDCDLVY